MESRPNTAYYMCDI